MTRLTDEQIAGLRVIAENSESFIIPTPLLLAVLDEVTEGRNHAQPSMINELQDYADEFERAGHESDMVVQFEHAEEMVRIIKGFRGGMS